MTQDYIIYSSRVYACSRAKAVTIPAVSVLSTLSPKRANIKLFAFILSRSLSDHPPSGPIQRCKSWSVSNSLNVRGSPIVSSVILVHIISNQISLSWNTISGTIMPPHCSTASRAIDTNLSILAGDNTSFCDLSERKNINLDIPTSTHFWIIYSIFSYLFGIAW